MSEKRAYKKYSSGLVLDGDVIKQRLEADRLKSSSFVHIDWLRFTVRSANLDFPSVDMLFPHSSGSPEILSIEDRVGYVRPSSQSTKSFSTTSIWDTEAWTKRFLSELARVPDCDQSPSGIPAQARELAEEVAEILGDGFTVAAEILVGHDHYKNRIQILHAEKEVAWIGFGAKSAKVKNAGNDAQAKTVHVNVMGAACTFGRYGWVDDMARLIERKKAIITRLDLALDFIHGYPGGIDRVVQDYKDGLCKVLGKNPSCNMLGDWVHGQARSFYIGSKQTGKQTNIYEKGDQLYGVDAGSEWVRFELRYGNKQRVIGVSNLLNPDECFAGASEWHASVLAEAQCYCKPSPIETVQQLQDETVEAAAYRVLSWALESASPAISLCFKHLTNQQLWSLLESQRIPKRMQHFHESTHGPAFRRAAEKLISTASVSPSSQAQDLADLDTVYLTA